MANFIEVANTNFSIGYIRDSGISQNYLEEVKRRIGECTTVCVIVTETLFLPLYYCSLEYTNYSDNNTANFYSISTIKPSKVLPWIKQHY